MTFKAEFKFDNSLVGVKKYVAKSKLLALCKFYQDISKEKLPSDCTLLSLEQI